MNDKLFQEKLLAQLPTGYQLNAPEFEVVNQWQGVIYQLSLASEAMDQLMVLKNKADAGLNEIVLFHFFVIQYIKCFGKTAPRRKKIDKSVINDPQLLALHEELDDIRNQMVAHNGISDLIKFNMATNVENDGITVKNLTSYVFERTKYESYFKLLMHVMNYVRARMAVDYSLLENKLGKKLFIEHHGRKIGLVESLTRE